jgi:hypothetical protein
MKTVTPTNYSQLAQILIKKMEIKICSYYGTEYSNYSVYIPRVYNSNKFKAKVRVLKNGDNVKNCLKITFNPERYDKKDIEKMINSNIRIIQNQLVGSCQNFLRINDLNQVLTGLIGSNGIHKAEAREMLNKQYEY